MQHLITIIAPDGTEHEFVLPQDRPLREMLYSILIYLKLPLTRYDFIDVKTDEPVSLDSTLRELFPAGGVRLRLENWQERIRRSVEASERYYQTLPPRTHHQAEEKRLRNFVFFWFVVFFVCGIVSMLTSEEKSVDPMQRSFEEFQELVEKGDSDARLFICLEYRDQVDLDGLRGQVSKYAVLESHSYGTKDWLTVERENNRGDRLPIKQSVRMEGEGETWMICDSAFLGISTSD